MKTLADDLHGGKDSHVNKFGTVLQQHKELTVLFTLNRTISANYLHRLTSRIIRNDAYFFEVFNWNLLSLK